MPRLSLIDQSHQTLQKLSTPKEHLNKGSFSWAGPLVNDDYNQGKNLQQQQVDSFSSVKLLTALNKPSKLFSSP